MHEVMEHRAVGCVLSFWFLFKFIACQNEESQGTTEGGDYAVHQLGCISAQCTGPLCDPSSRKWCLNFTHTAAGFSQALFLFSRMCVIQMCMPQHRSSTGKISIMIQLEKLNTLIRPRHAFSPLTLQLSILFLYCFPLHT